MLKAVFDCFILGPLPRRAPGEGPDCRFESKIGGFGTGSGGLNIFLIFIVALSTARIGHFGVWGSVLIGC